MLVLDPNAPEQSQNEVLKSVESMIRSAGTLVGRHDWGVRRLAYEIDHRPEGAYHLFQLETGDVGLLERLDHSLKIADGVLRFRIIRLKPGSPPPPTPRPDSRGRDREGANPTWRAPRPRSPRSSPRRNAARRRRVRAATGPFVTTSRKVRELRVTSRQSAPVPPGSACTLA